MENHNPKYKTGKTRRNILNRMKFLLCLDEDDLIMSQQI